MLWKKIRIGFILFFLLSSCYEKKEKNIEIFDHGLLVKDKALSFLKNASKLQFHLDSSQSLIQDYPSLTNDFLLQNIDLSYGKSDRFIKKGLISEYSFVNYVLPYKVNASAPHSWRHKSLEIYNLKDKEINECSNLNSILKLCLDIDKKTKSLLKYKLDGINENYLTLDDILKKGTGSCLSFCDLTTYICRANGIPVTFDYVPAWGNLDGGHAWSVFVPTQNEFYPFCWPDSENNSFDPLLFVNSERKEIFSKKNPPKIYRRGFIPDTSSIFLKHFKNLNTVGTTFTDIDVTNQYVKTIDFNIKSIFKRPSDVLLLNVFNGGKWVPVSAISPQNKQYEFNNIGVENLYLISSINYKYNLFLFYVDRFGKVSKFDKGEKQRILIKRDRSIVQQQLDYINNNGWNLPKSIKNLSQDATPNLSDKIEYQIFELKNGVWKLLENKTPKNKEIITEYAYPDGLYIITPKNVGINSKTRPFVFLKGEIIFI